MQVHRRRVGDRHFVRLGANQFRNTSGERFRHREPRNITVEPPADPAGFPLVQDSRQALLRVAAEKPERVAIEVDLVFRHIEARAEFTQRIGSIALLSLRTG